MASKAGTPTHVEHGFGPVWDAGSRVLVLGSMPSPKSREMRFYYGHPRNRFWPVMAAIFGDGSCLCEECDDPAQVVSERTDFALRHHVALWDVIASCEIRGSSDASIRNAIPNDLTKILDIGKIRQVYVNGQTAGRLYRKYQEEPLCSVYGDCARAIILPSTSPANAAWTLDRLCDAWSIIRA